MSSQPFEEGVGYLGMEDSEYFANYEPETQKKLVAFMKNLMRVSHKVRYIQYWLMMFGAVIIIFHLVVLTRKQMRTSATNYILIGISVFDLFVLIPRIQNFIYIYILSSIVCGEIIGYWQFVIDDILFSIYEHSRTCSSCLGIMLALIRVVAVSKVMDARYDFISRPGFGKAIVVGVFFVNLPISLLKHFHWEVIPAEPFIVTDACAALNITLDDHASQEREFYANHELLVRVYTFIDGLVTQMIPTIVFPILTICLVRILRKTKKLRAQKVLVEPEHDKSATTTKLVIVMTITYMAYTLPTGLLSWFETFSGDLEPGIAQLMTSYTEIHSIVFVVNTIIHCFICFGMSSQYRDTVRGLLARSSS